MFRPHIQAIQKQDNPQVAKLIRSVFEELGVPRKGTAYEDPSLDQMYETYLPVGAAYFVLKKNETIVGGCGVGPLNVSGQNICELQKMYFSPEARGRGWGKLMMKHCLEKAKQSGYDKCYLETMPAMQSAVKLYEKFGFSDLPGALGDTGHFGCNKWMILDFYPTN